MLHLLLPVANFRGDFLSETCVAETLVMTLSDEDSLTALMQVEVN